jgi:dipeptidyl aminopeptidase/acylaminoacyl peptidase
MRLLSLSARALLCAALPFPLLAQQVAQNTTQKKPLTQADWDRWRSINNATLSNDGKWAAYTLTPQVGDGEFVVRATSGTTEYRVPVGYIGRPNNVPGGLRPPQAGPGAGRGPAAAGRFGGAASTSPFSADSRFAFVVAQSNKAEIEALQRQWRAARAQGGNPAATDTVGTSTLVIVSLADGKTTPIAGVRSFRLPKDNGKWVVYSAPDTSRRAAGDSANRAGGANRGGGRPGGQGGRGPQRQYGTSIVLRNLDTGAEQKIDDVLTYTFDDSARVLAYTVVSRDSTKDGAYIRDLAKGTTQALLTGRGNYRAFTFDRAQQQFVFTSDRDEFGKPNARSTLYYGTMKTGKAESLVASSILPKDMHLADNAPVTFTRTGTALLLNIAPPPLDTIPADSLVGKSQFDLWHYRDPDLQPTQKLQLARERNKTYQAIYNLQTKKLVQLTTDSLPNVLLSDDGRFGLSATSVAYNIQRMWGEDGDDVYIVDPATGTRKLIKQKISGQASLSTDGKFVLFFDNGHYYTYSMATGKTVDLTAPLPNVHFDQETWSTPSTPAAWGVAGWTKGDKSVLLYDRFDIWELDPTGAKPAVVVTDSLGRRESIVFRLVDLDRTDDERAIDPAKPLMLRAFSEATKASGFYRDRLGAKADPEKIVMADLAYGVPQKARNADVYMVTKSTFIDFPNLWVGPSLTNLTKISDANPQQSQYNWGTAELVTWTSADGVALQGILYKPENFDPNKKYPMISYFYEDLSDGLHNYIAPNGRNVINPTHYVSNGYLIFEPDIHYEIGYPGPSAVKSIVPGVQKLLERGYVDPKGLGLQGQSWGGYQTLFIITQSQMFSAAMAGAPVVNMFSAYGGIRWGTGIARAFQYEKTQSRIGKSIWEAPNQYMENSPLFWLPRVTTPLFTMNNDADDAVPWYQGIELFVAMRRLGKEMYFVNYNNDVHNPASRANQKDIAARMQQFFDTKLKGAPAPDWMVHGIPAKDKGRDQVTMQIQATTQSQAVVPNQR